jgi:hypothetical protein
MRACLTSYGEWERIVNEDKALTLIPQIKEAHEKVENSQQTSYNQALEYAIKAGDLLTLAKETVGPGGWAKWREQNLRQIPQTTASLYMRLAKHKDLFKENKISNSVADLRSHGKLSLRAAAACLPKRPQTLPQKAAIAARKEAQAELEKNDEGKAKEYLNALAPDELVVVLRELHGADYLRELSVALSKVVPKVDPLDILPELQRTAQPAPASFQRKV